MSVGQQCQGKACNHECPGKNSGRTCQKVCCAARAHDAEITAAATAAASADTKPTALAALYENDGNHAKRKKKVNYQNNSLHGLETLVLKLPIRTLLWPDRAKI
jgi:hypothetical protein